MLQLRIRKRELLKLLWYLPVVILSAAAVVSYGELWITRALATSRIVYLENQLDRRVAVMERELERLTRNETDTNAAVAWRLQDIELRQDFTSNHKRMGMEAGRRLATEIYRQRLMYRYGRPAQ